MPLCKRQGLDSWPISAAELPPKTPDAPFDLEKVKTAVDAAFDPEGMTAAARMMEGVTFAETAYEAAAEADALVIVTEWHEFRGLDPRRLKQMMRQPRIVDLRNIFDPVEMRAVGFAYEGVGRYLNNLQ